jgi:WD40 repeat protein
MSCLIVPIFALAILAADQPLVPSVRLDSGGEAWPAALTPDGKSLLGVVKDGDNGDVVVWDTVDRSRSVLAKGKGAASLCVGSVPLCVSPGRRSVAWLILTEPVDEASGVADMDVVIWNATDRSTTALLKLKKALFFCMSADFSPDSSLLAFGDGNTKKVHLWKRGATAKWVALPTLEVAQRQDAPKPTFLETKFSRDGKQLFAFFLTKVPGESFSSAVAVERWDTASGRPLSCRIQPTRTFIWWTGPLPHVVGEGTLCLQAPEGSGGGVVGLDISSGKKSMRSMASPWGHRCRRTGKLVATRIAY